MRSRLTRANLLAGAALVAAAWLHVWTGLQVDQIGYELSRAHELGVRLERELDELTVEYAAATSPERLEAEARRLGLEPPAPGQVVVLR